jgi:hypothetical protein
MITEKELKKIKLNVDDDDVDDATEATKATRQSRRPEISRREAKPTKSEVRTKVKHTTCRTRSTRFLFEAADGSARRRAPKKPNMEVRGCSRPSETENRRKTGGR